MPAPRSASLRRRFPRRLDIPLLLVASTALLALGLTTPALETTALIFWKDEYSVLTNLRQLSDEGRTTAAAILALSTIVYPALKIVLLTFFWLFPFPAKWRWRSIRLIRLLGRWGMVDVFAITAILLASQTIGPLHATPRPGLFYYAAGILTLMTTSLLMDRMTRTKS